MLGVASGWVTARIMSLDKPTTTALMFGFSMKHTGLALVLADTIAQQETAGDLNDRLSYAAANT